MAAEDRSATDYLGTSLARHELRLLSLQAELESTPRLTAWEDAPLDLDRLLAPITRTVVEVASAIGAPRQVRSRRTTMGGHLSVLWADFTELEPPRLVRHWGFTDVPAAWAELHSRLLGTVQEALGQLRG